MKTPMEEDMADDNDLLGELEQALKPYREEFPTFTRIPEAGRDKEEIIREMEALKEREEARWRDGYASGAVYSGDEEHVDFLNRVYAISSQTNPLHSDLWPSITKFEAEVTAMTANMLGADKIGADAGPEDQICGVVSSGGTESILLAMKTHRDRARELKGVTAPEMIVPTTVHAAFDKASQYFNIKMIKIPVGPDFRADVAETAKAVNENTVVIAGSAPSFPHGVIDPIEELSELARKADVGFHTDACLGGFILPWAEKLGYDVPPFDFRLPGVTSMSADTHKYGYAAKGSSVVLYRGPGIRRHQFYITTDWPGGIYFSPTFAGSRAGAMIASAWASMTALGERGYMECARRILETASFIKKGIREIPGLYILGEPLWDVAFASDEFNIYKVMHHMAGKNWSLNGLQSPPAVHICTTLRHTSPGVAERFLDDLKEAVAHVRANPEASEGELGALYGLSANIEFKGMVEDLVGQYIDMLYKS
ncbi:MAG: aminotransferase class V-fold PLP-dependent enzyme [Desulfobacterales bacterium]|nr:aminotransferase class V-fold PLP-dependent enzyme [Desulfobacterales bacterium]